MSDLEYTRMKLTEIEQICEKYFKTALTVNELLFDDVTTGQGSYTTIFNTSDRELYALCLADGPLRLTDVEHIIKSMNIHAEEYISPNADKNYFLRLGYEAFLNAYPGRSEWSDQEAHYYRTLAPYNPALIKIARIDGEIRRYNTFASRWQKVDDFSYIKTLPS